MSNAVERLNNAISAITVATTRSNASAGVKAAVEAMGNHWGRYWREDRPTDGVWDQDRLERYLKWYTRAWCIVPESVRTVVPRPDSIDVAWSKLALDSIAQYTDSAAGAVRDASNKAAALSAYVDKKAAALAKAAGEGVAAIGNLALMLGVAALGWYVLTRKE